MLCCASAHASGSPGGRDVSRRHGASLAFCTETGGPLYPDTVSALIGKLATVAGLPHARLHDLRHLHATTLLLAREPVHVVAARLGHADPAITLRVYAHVVQEQAASAANVFADAVEASRWQGR